MTPGSSWAGLQLDERLVDEESVRDARRRAAATNNDALHVTKKQQILDAVRGNEGCSQNHVLSQKIGGKDLVRRLIADLIAENRLFESFRGQTKHLSTRIP